MSTQPLTQTSLQLILSGGICVYYQSGSWLGHDHVFPIRGHGKVDNHLDTTHAVDTRHNGRLHRRLLWRLCEPLSLLPVHGMHDYQ